MKNINSNTSINTNGEYYLTDGGLETSLIYHHGINLPHFAAFELLNYRQGKDILKEYYKPYLELAGKYGLNYILDTPTWRANPDWGFRMGYTRDDLNMINRTAVRFIRDLKSTCARDSNKILISGDIGPRGDGYSADLIMSPPEAADYHFDQIRIFAEEEADLATALTLNYSDEAIGIILSAKKVRLPVVISFTVETNGELPDGERLQEAIEKTDELTQGYALHYMINCAHPSHFRNTLKNEGNWKKRIRGIRANASTKSHAELDSSDSLDTGDKPLLASGYAELKKLLPELRVIGGCCGTDHSHMEEICNHVFGKYEEIQLKQD